MTQPEKMGEMRKLIGNLTPDMLMSDVAACLDVLASRADVDATRVGAVGYCMGGRNAFIAATRFPDRLRAAASIHPGGIVTADPASPHLLAATVQARLYFGIAKDDVFFTKEQAESLEQTLAAMGKRQRGSGAPRSTASSGGYVTLPRDATAESLWFTCALSIFPSAAMQHLGRDVSRQLRVVRAANAAAAAGAEELDDLVTADASPLR